MKDELIKMLLLLLSVFPGLSALLGSAKAPLAQYEAEEAGSVVVGGVVVVTAVGIDHLGNYQRELE